MKTILLNIGILLMSVVVVYVTAVKQDTVVYNKEDLKTISCGLPFEFLTSDQSWRDPPYPWTASCGGGEWGDQVIVEWPAFAGNVLMYFLAINLFFAVFKVIKKKFYNTSSKTT